MPDEWTRSMLIFLYKGKGDIKLCGNYRGIKLMSHTMKLWEKVIEARIRKEVTIADRVHARKENHQCNLLSEDAVGKVD